MNIRSFVDTDLEPITRLFTESVHTLAVGAYGDGQREAWAPRPPDTDYWRRRLQPLRTLVAENDGELVGFISFQENGHIDMMYTAPRHSRRGVATVLFKRVEATLISLGVIELFTEASLVARPFFERHGFRVTEEQNVSVRGTTLTRFAMSKPQVAAQQGVPADVARPAGERRG